MTTHDGQRSCRYYDFSPYVVDAVKRVLLRDGDVVPLTSKAFEILLTLLQRRDHVVDKDDLMQEVWRGTVVEENNLVRNISTLRKALNETPTEHRYIVTIPGRGYRFVADVIERHDPAIQGRQHEPAELPVPDRQPDPVFVPPAAAQAQDGWMTSRARSLALAASGLFVVGIVVVSVMSGLRADESAPPRKIWQVTFDAGRQAEPTWSPDGRAIAYSSDRSGNLDLWVQPVGGGSPTAVTSSPADDWQPAWSPGGQLVAFRSERDGGGIYVVPSGGGEARRAAEFGYHPRWSPDGKQILFHRSNFQGLVLGAREIYTVGLDGSPAHQVLGDVLRHFSSFKTSWHPDGRRLSIWGVHVRDGLTFLTVALDGTRPAQSSVRPGVREALERAGVKFIDNEGLPMEFAWAPSGDALYFEGISAGVHNLWKVGVDPNSLEWNRGPDALTTGADVGADLALTFDGGKLAFVQRTERIRLWSFPFDAAKGRITGRGNPITPAGVIALAPEISPDGRKVAYKIERGSSQELWQKSLETGEERLLIAGDRARRGNVVWSRDSESLIYSLSMRAAGSDEVIRRDLVTLATSGGGERVLTSLQRMLDLPLDLSSDGRWVLGTSLKTPREHSTLALFTNARGTEAIEERRVASDPGSNLYQARVSPDQRWVAYSAARPGLSAVYTAPLNGGAPVPITEGQFFDDRPRWSPDGKTIYFLSNRLGLFNVWGRRFDPVTGTPVGEAFQVTSFYTPGQMIPPRMTQLGISIAADRLIVPIDEVTGNVWVLEGLVR